LKGYQVDLYERCAAARKPIAYEFKLLLDRRIEKERPLPYSKGLSDSRLKAGLE